MHGVSSASTSSSSTSSQSNSLWGGRFAAGPSEIMTRINASIDVDRRLYAQDIRASKAHAAMLEAVGLISAEDLLAIDTGLDQIEAEIKSGSFAFSSALEDIHMNVESRLKELIGTPAGRLHTARSRNDQVATDFRLWVRDAIDGQAELLSHLIATLLNRAKTETQTVLPGFTHLQPAQPISLAHHLHAYATMFLRDLDRLGDVRKRLNLCPLGSAALAGTPYPIDRQQTAAALAFLGPTANSLDSVSDRDFALEYMAAGSLCALHLSRLAEELVIWTGPQFNFARLSDAFSTGSSIMPQKRNPDAAELLRAQVGRIAGGFQSLLIVMKGLPLAYSKDMQEDKAVTFEAVDTLTLGLQAMAGMIADIDWNRDVMAAACDQGHVTATDLADWLVRVLHLPFRQAHHVTGRLVALADEKGVQVSALSLDELQSQEPRIEASIFEVLTPKASMASRKSLGGTSPTCVAQAITASEQALANLAHRFDSGP